MLHQFERLSNVLTVNLLNENATGASKQQWIMGGKKEVLFI